MKKKIYEQPKLKVAKLEQTEIICTSQFNPPSPSPQNESYEEENETTTNGWFN